MSDWTKEPWSLGFTTQVKEVDPRLGVWWRTPIHVGLAPNRGNCFAEVSLGGPGATDHSEGAVKANAARIVACVNALAGIRDPAAAVQAAREALKIALLYRPSERHREQIRAALALLEGGTDG